MAAPGESLSDDPASSWRRKLLRRVHGWLTAVAMLQFALSLGATSHALLYNAITAALYALLAVAYWLRRRLSLRVHAVALTALMLVIATYQFWWIGISPGVMLLYALLMIVAAAGFGWRGSGVVLGAAVASMWLISAATGLGAHRPELAYIVQMDQPLSWVRMSIVFSTLLALITASVAFAVALIDRHMTAQAQAIVALEREIERRTRAEAERERAHAELLRVQKSEVIGKLAAAVVHDFNNALTVVLACTDHLRRGNHVAADAADLDAIEHAARTASELSRRVLVLARRAPLATRPIRLDQFLRDAARTFGRALSGSVEVSVDAAEVPEISGDPGQLDQVLLNLAFNARDAMPAGGALRVRTFTGVPGSAPPGSPPWVALQVEDTGTGIDASVKAHLFEPFVSTKGDRGTGLGLASVHAIVGELGGTIEVRSEQGRGTCFTLWFPALPVRAPVAAETARVTGGARLILLAEDEAPLRDAYARVLGAAGYEVITAVDGSEAVAIARQRAGGFALLCTDGSMPGEPVPGLIREFVELNPGARVLVCSGYIDSKMHAISGPQVSFLPKPFRLQELVEAARTQLEAGGAAPSRQA